ncbi:two-component system response regulator [Pseudarthrobacter sp. N5]|uniref:two-component system response regulator n=1 Tax=Pseudarthrobacter sp. N5 TaxID=3418416 RepID=UPI003CF92E49
MSAPTNRRILLIDDTPSIHEDFRRILSDPGAGAGSEMAAAEEALFGEAAEPASVPGFDLDSAYQGREGLEMVCSSVKAASPYALAFVDMRMPPGWDGVETVREIWKVDPRLQIVICTAHSDYSWDELLGKLGADDRLLVLKKPFDNIEVAQLASALTTKWDMTGQAELKVSRLEEAVLERTRALEIANKELEALIGEVTQLATHDGLTGLPNRLLFADRASQALAAARRDGSCPVVLILDLDRFKEVNDSLGHLHGDLLLTQVAQRLSGVLRPGDTVARLGGDEFALLLADGGSGAGDEVAKRIAQVLAAPFILGDSMVGAEASIGIAAAASDEHPTLEELLRQADIAMYQAKTYRSGFAHFAACNEDGTPNGFTLIGELRQAIDCEELVVYYQPKVAVDTGELLGVEALVRWQHPTRGLLQPAEFMAVAEGSALIQRLTTVVLDMVLRCCRTWLDEGLRLPVAVNVNARSLCDPRFPALVSDRLAYAGVPADLLTIELTEGTALACPGPALGILQDLRDAGVHFSVDDYGTGYSSMAYLKNLPVTELKIDQAFIKGMINDPHDATIVQSSTELGHNLGMSVVAEGVEDEMTLATLKSIGVDVAQGYHIGHPMPEDLLRRWIEDRTGALTQDAGTPPDPALPRS